MSEQNYSIERDLKEAEAMAAALTPYVYEDELYGRIGMNMPSLTLGGLLLRLRRLRALQSQLTSAQSASLQQAEAQLHSVSREWSSHYEKKLVQETEARLRDIMTYLRESSESPRAAAGAYMPEALRRTIIQEIVDAMPDSERGVVQARVQQVDSGLRRYLAASDFIWSALLKPVYPADRFWWLYNRPGQAKGKKDAH
jgi:hypothetical protein